MEEHRIMEKIVKSLPLKFDLIVTPIEEAKDLLTMTVDELMKFLKIHD